ncbi:phenylacetyl-CoA ligase [Cytidiella melzeri]|nr:phenylacetyl-CoA ligase [Cytidiella melzeri]
MSTAVIPPRPYVAPPDDLTVPQFVFDYTHPTRPERPLDLPCMVEDETGREVYLHQLKARTNAFAAWLQESYKLGVDDVVALCSPNHVDYGPVCWGVHEVGGIIAAMSPGLTPSEMEHQFRLVTPKLIVAHPLTVKNVQSALSQLDGIVKADIILLGPVPTGIDHRTFEDILTERTKRNATERHFKLAPGASKTKTAFLCFSSGTTGPPKAVAISHYNVIVSVVQIATAQGVNDSRLTRDQARFRVGDVTTGVLPFFHIYGLSIHLHFGVYSALTTVVTAVFNFEQMLRNIVRYKITILFIVPPQATLLVKHPVVKSYDISHIHCIGLAAAPLSPEITSEILATWPHIHLGQGFGKTLLKCSLLRVPVILTPTCMLPGTTESTGGVTMWPLFPKCGKLGTAGAVLPGGQIKVVKPDGTLAKKGETGELLVKGDYVALGYYHNPEATKSTFLEGGWLCSGDEVMVTEDDLLVIVDRIKEIIKVKGLQVSPAELEGHLLGHADVADVGVVGVHDDYAGELPVAFVVLREATKARISSGSAQAEQELKTQIMKHVSDAKSKYKWLKEVYIIDAMPRNPSGKILRRILRDDVNAGRYNVPKANL